MTPLAPDRLRLIVLTDRGLAAPRSVEDVVEEALEAGAPAIQLRDKKADARTLTELGRRLLHRTKRRGALLFVNDRVDVALAIGADGVHLGPDDLPVAAVRGFVPPDFLIGVSTDDPEEARAAQAAGADYLGVGTVWPTSSKGDAGRAIGPDGVRRVTAAVDLPVVAIGGITTERIALLRDTGATGVAVLGAVMGSPAPGETVRTLLDGLMRGRSG